jgi:hypothetical protein
MGTKATSAPTKPAPTAAPRAASPAVAPSVQPRGNAAAADRLSALNSQRPGTPEAQRPPPDLSALERLGYTVHPIAQVDVLYAAAKKGPDAPLSAQKQGPGGYDAVLSGTFTTDYVQSAGPMMRDGRMDTQGHAKAKERGGMAVLEDGSVVIGRAKGRTAEEVQATFGSAENRVKDFMGGGALLVEGSRAVSDDDLYARQRFDQGAGGIRAQQMRATHHVLVGIRDGQAFAIVAREKSGAQMQKDLLAHGFDSVVKYDGGSGGYARDGAGGAPEYRGVNTTGMGIRKRR